MPCKCENSIYYPVDFFLRDCFKLLTNQQMEELRFRGNPTFDEMLCKICKLLSKEEMQHINDVGSKVIYSEVNLFNWYKEHLLHDIESAHPEVGRRPDKDEAEKIYIEVERLGLKFIAARNNGEIMDVSIREKESEGE